MKEIEAKPSLLKDVGLLLASCPFGFSDLPSAVEETGGEGTEATKAHWEELLQSVSNFIFRLIISKHYGCSLTGVKRSEIL